MRAVPIAMIAIWLTAGTQPADAVPKKPAKKPAKKAPAPKPAEPPDEPAPEPAATDPAKDARTPDKPAPGTGSPGSTGDGDKKEEPAPPTDVAPPDTKASSNQPDVDTLRQEYLSLRDELFKSRARANAVASQLYSTRIQIRLTYTSGRYYNPTKASIRLDGASVYENTTGAIAGDDGIRFDGYVAPGRHLVTFRVEATGKDDDSFASVTESQIVVKAVADKDLVVAAKAKDGGDISYEWKKKEKGSYGLAIDVAVKTQARAAEGKKAKP